MQNTNGEIATKLASIRLFEGVDAAVVDEVARSTHVIKLQKGRLVYSAGTDARAIYHVVSGQLKVAVSSPDGGEKVIDIITAGQDVGVAELFGNVPYVSYAAAVVPTVLLQVGREGIRRALELDHRISQRLLRAMGERQASIERDIAANSFQSGCRRVVDYLLRLAGPGLSSGETTVDLGIPKHLLAARLGFTPETLSRAFRCLSDAGLINVRGKLVTLSNKLASAAESDAIDPSASVSSPPRNRHRTAPWFDHPSRPASTGLLAWM